MKANHPDFAENPLEQRRYYIERSFMNEHSVETMVKNLIRAHS